MSKKALKRYLYALEFVSKKCKKIINMKKILQMNVDYSDEDHVLVQWYNDYKQGKTEKAGIKEELLCEGCHPSK